MPIYALQANMNRGELDPRALGRADIDAYYNGLRTATNVLPMPQGGVEKRPGMKYLGEALGYARVESFSFNVEQSYLLVFTNLKMQVYKDGVLQTNLNGSGNDYIVSPWTTAQIADFDFIQSADTAIVTHEDVAPRTIIRTGHTAWGISTIALSNIPQYDFDDGSSPSPVSEVQALNFGNHAQGDRYKISLEGILSDEVVFAGDDAANIENIRRGIQEMPHMGSSGVSVATSVSMDTYTVTLAGSSARPWKLLTVTPVYTASASFGVGVTRSVTGTSRAEDSWSSTRGWPKTTTFHEGRLWFGGSKSRPATLWGSRVGDFFNFDTFRARDNAGIDATLDTDQVNAIEAIFSNRTLQIFTSGGEFYVPESPVTPSNIAVKPQTNFGSARVRPVTIDGVTLFVQRSGNSINRFVYSDAYQAHEAQSITTAAAHLIKTPYKLAVSRGDSSSDANYVYINNTDGNVTVFNTLIAEDVHGFTSWQTEGDVISLTTVDEVAYFCVKRTIESVDRYFIEKEDNTIFTDCAVVETLGAPTDTLTGLTHLEGETVDIRADGVYMGTAVVTGGEITIVRNAELTLEAGLPYRPTIRTMPLNVQTNNGPNVFAKKKIQRVALRVHESNGVRVNGQLIADTTIGVNQFDPPEPQSKEVRVHVLGWSIDASITITQDSPMPMTILSIGVEVAV